MRNFAFYLVIGLLFSCSTAVDLPGFLAQELLPHPNDYHVVDQQNLAISSLDRALKYYEAGEFEEAQIFLREYKKLFHTQQEVDFFLAQTDLGLGQLAEAEEKLRSITGAGRYYAQALWYRVLILAKNGELVDARKLLKSFALIAEQHDYKVKEAAQLENLMN